MVSKTNQQQNNQTKGTQSLSPKDKATVFSVYARTLWLWNDKKYTYIFSTNSKLLMSVVLLLSVQIDQFFLSRVQPFISRNQLVLV